jgi:hypothetical protein
MKKLILLFTIACIAGQMYGMGPERGRYIGMVDLPKEVQVLIIQALNKSKNRWGNVNIDKAIRAIVAMSLTSKTLNEIVNKAYGNQKGFKALINELATVDVGSNPPHFKKRSDIAQKFKTGAARRYVKLGNALAEAVQKNNIGKVTELLEQGADVNFDSDIWVIHPRFTHRMMPLSYAVHRDNAEMVKLLLFFGAEVESKKYYWELGEGPHYLYEFGGVAWEQIQKDRKTVEHLLEEARKQKLKVKPQPKVAPKAKVAARQVPNRPVVKQQPKVAKKPTPKKK